MEADDQAIQTTSYGLPEDIMVLLIVVKLLRMESHVTIRSSNEGLAYDRLNSVMRMLEPMVESFDSSAAERWYSYGYNAVQNVRNQVVQDAVQNQGVQNVGTQNGQIVVLGITNQNPNEEWKCVSSSGEGDATGNNGKKQGIPTPSEEQASTSGTQTDNAPVYDSEGILLSFWEPFALEIDQLLQFGFDDLQWGHIFDPGFISLRAWGTICSRFGQFCDSDLEVAFRRNCVFVRNLAVHDDFIGGSTVICSETAAGCSDLKFFRLQRQLQQQQINPTPLIESSQATDLSNLHWMLLKPARRTSRSVNSLLLSPGKTIIWVFVYEGFWIELTGFSDADYAGCKDTFKSTFGGAQFLGEKLVSWSSKKQDSTALSTAEAEYMSLSVCCAQVLWMRTQLTDYGFNFNKIPIYYDSKSSHSHHIMQPGPTS
ncbi:hypothetical protein Tco_0379675 [Tanacetum coccineum]